MVRIFHLHRENLVKEFEIIYLVVDINNFNFLVWTLSAGGGLRCSAMPNLVTPKKRGEPLITPSIYKNDTWS